ncbi:hypothetical protein JW964_04490 [candidate division KSB1 bacterium]|nr:hypothetical protein [candidate division KSB1 bacterium]
MSVKTEPQDLKFPPAALNELVLALKENRLNIVVGSGLSTPLIIERIQKIEPFYR